MPGGGPAIVRPPERRPAVSVVLPVHDQADHLQRIVQRYRETFVDHGIDHELILVANGCSDATPALAAELGRAHASVRTIASPTSGWGHAVKLGIAAARADLVAYTNSARTDAGDLVAAVLLALNNPGVVVKANRRIRESLFRRAGSVIYNFECRTLFDLACWDINGTPKVFPRACTPLMSLTREDDLLDLEFVVAAREARYPLVEMPIVSTARHGGRSTTNLRRAARMYWGALRFWRSRARGRA